MARRGLWHAVLVLLVLRNAILASAGVFSGNAFGFDGGGLCNAISADGLAVGFGMLFWLGRRRAVECLFFLAGGWLWYAILAVAGGGLGMRF